MKAILATIAAGALLAGCASLGGTPGPKAAANLAATKGNTASGTVTFEQKGDKVRVAGTITGLRPNGEHGFHVHEKGDCSSGDGMSAGGHFNPLGKSHGHHGSDIRHAGDMPNLKADASGTATFSIETTGITIRAGATGPPRRNTSGYRRGVAHRSLPVS